MQTDIYARLRDLAASAEAKPAEMRPILLRVTTDLFVLHAQHTPQEIRLYEEMACKLVDGADEATLTLVARKLARCADAPASVLKRIRARGGAAAQEILLVDAQIEWRDLRQIAASGGFEQACAIARRSDLDREIAKILAGRPEREVARALAGNTLAPLAADDLRLMCARGREDSALAQALLSRGDVTLDHLPLYLSASPEQRGKLIGLVRAAGLAQTGRGDAAAPLDDEACARLEAGALRQKRSSFALTLAEIMGCDPLSARKIVDEESGEALTLAFISIGLPEEVGARIFLIAFPKVALSAEIFGRNIALYKSLRRRDAARIVAAITGEARSPGATYLRGQARRAPLGFPVGVFAGESAPAQDEARILPAMGR
jgi:hypothetical protein